MNLPFILTQAARAFPTETTLMDADGNITFEQLQSRVQSAMRRLQDYGLKSGDCLAIEAFSTREVIILLWAAMALKLIALPLNPRLPEETFRDYLHQFDCGAVYAPTRSKVFARKHVELKPFSGSERPQREMVGALPKSIREQQAVTVVLTSGSTGRPRAVVHAYGNHYYSALGSNQNIPLQHGDRWLLSLPLFHVAGIAILFRTMLAGATVVVPRQNSDLAGNIRQFRPTHLSLVATQLSDLLQDARSVAHLRGMKAVLMGGSAIPRNLLKNAFREKLPLVLSYGSSEMSSQITATAPGDSWQSWLTSGRVLPFRELTIDATGEILVRGKTLFLGYWQKGRLWRELNEDGWFATGDLGTLDGERRLIVRGRKDRMFISGGENIYPEEIERALENLPAIEKAVVVPVPDQRFGQRPLAFVQTADGTKADEASLKEALRRTLPGFKIPRSILPWPHEAPQGMKTDLKWFERFVQRTIR